jgi:hypothetical protein
LANLKVATEEPSRRSSESKSAEWRPLEKFVGSKPASGTFVAELRDAEVRDGSATLVFSGVKVGSVPVIGLLAKSVAAALTPEKGSREKGKAAEAIDIEAKRDGNRVEVKFGIEVDDDFLADLKTRLSKPIDVLYNFDGDEVTALLDTDEGRAVLSSLRSDEEFEPAWQAFMDHLKDRMAKPVQVSKVGLAPTLGKIDAGYLGVELLKDDMAKFKFECNKAARPILEILVKHASGEFNPHRGDDAEAVWRSKGGAIGFYRGGTSEEHLVKVGAQISDVVEALLGIDAKVAEGAFATDAGLALLSSFGSDAYFEPAFAAWKETLKEVSDSSSQ